MKYQLNDLIRCRNCGYEFMVDEFDIDRNSAFCICCGDETPLEETEQ